MGIQTKEVSQFLEVYTILYTIYKLQDAQVSQDKLGYWTSQARALAMPSTRPLRAARRPSARAERGAGRWTEARARRVPGCGKITSSSDGRGKATRRRPDGQGQWRAEQFAGGPAG